MYLFRFTLPIILFFFFCIPGLTYCYQEYKYNSERQQKVDAFNEQIRRSLTSPYEIVDIGGGGHVDGGHKIGLWPFTRYHSTALYIYTGKLKVTHNDQTALLNIEYYFEEYEQDIVRKKQKEGIKIDPYELVIGVRKIEEHIENGKKQYDVVKGTGKEELDKLQAIGLSKEEFETTLKKHFTKISYY